MKKLMMLLLAMYVSHAVQVQAQKTETDSLKKQLLRAREDHFQVMILEGLSYAYLSSYPDTALQYALKGLELAKKINDQLGEATCTNAIGNVYSVVGDYSNALDMYLRALQMKEALKDQHNIAVYYYNIANVYMEQQDYPHALHYLFKAKNKDETAGDSTGILFDLYGLGTTYLRMEKADSALYYFRQSEVLCNRLGEKNLIGAIMNSYGDVYSLLNDFQLAKQYYHRSISYVQEITDNEVLASNYYGLAKIYNQNSMIDSAIYFARKALWIAREGPFFKQVLETSTFLADVFKAQKQLDSAFTYLEISIATKDSLFNGEEVKKVQNLKLQEQQRQQMLEIANIEYRNKVKLFTVGFASLTFLLIAFVLWRINNQKQKAYTLLQQQKTKTDDALYELKSTQTQLIQREKMASLGELTAGIAHEIQNPLNFVNNFSEVSSELVEELWEEKKKDERDEQIEDEILTDLKINLEKIRHHGHRADSIVKGMLQHARTSSGEKQLTDLNKLTDEYLRLSYQGMRAKDKDFNASLVTDFDACIDKIDVVPQEIGRVLLNLFNNAFYATEQKRKIALNGYLPEVKVSTKKIGNQVEICVRDNGTGIAEAVKQKIFQPFFTTKPTGEGAGLGLSLSFDIVTKGHGGEMNVASKEGEYAEFTIRLPANANPSLSNS